MSGGGKLKGRPKSLSGQRAAQKRLNDGAFTDVTAPAASPLIFGDQAEVRSVLKKVLKGQFSFFFF